MHICFLILIVKFMFEYRKVGTIVLYTLRLSKRTKTAEQVELSHEQRYIPVLLRTEITEFCGWF